MTMPLGAGDMPGGSGGGLSAGWEEAQAYLRRFNTVSGLERSLSQLSGSYFLNPSDEMLLRLCYGMKEMLKGATVQEKEAEAALSTVVERVRMLAGGRRSEEDAIPDQERLVRIASEAFTAVAEHIQELRHTRSNVPQNQRVYLAQPNQPGIPIQGANNGQPQPQWFEDGADGATSGVIQALQNDLRMIMQQQGASKDEPGAGAKTSKSKKAANKRRENSKPTLRPCRRPFDAFWASNSSAYAQQYPILDYNQRRSLGWEEWRKMDEESKKKWKVDAEEYNRNRLERGVQEVQATKRKREEDQGGKRERKDDYRSRAMHYFVRERMAEISLLAPTANWATKMSRIRKEWKGLAERSKWQGMADEFKRTGVEPADNLIGDTLIGDALIGDTI